MAKRKNNVERPRNGGLWSEAKYWGTVRSALRRAFRYWNPIQQAKSAARRPYKGPNKRQKWEFQCASCKKWWKADDVQVDHVIPCGSLKCEDDLIGWLRRLTEEDPNAFQVLCKEKCHKEKTEKESKERNSKNHNEIDLE